jgi:voltage-gated potassium channel Kch
MRFAQFPAIHRTTAGASELMAVRDAISALLIRIYYLRLARGFREGSLAEFQNLGHVPVRDILSMSIQRYSFQSGNQSKRT